MAWMILERRGRLVRSGVCLQVLLLVGFVAQGASAEEQVGSATFCPTEELAYDISWSGGIKIGEMSLSVEQAEPGACEIRARVLDSGLFHLFYPVNDTFVTQVTADWLPINYEVKQREGGRDGVLRQTRYDQEQGLVFYRKNQGAEHRFEVDGPVHNEFSSFFTTRFLPWSADQNHFVVPTWADESRNLVDVELRGSSRVQNRLLGRVEALEVLPRMTFKGLYDKSGDTVIWFTADSCRIPLRIHSKILIGSLIAELKEYRGERCPEWTERMLSQRALRRPRLDVQGD